LIIRAISDKPSGGGEKMNKKTISLVLILASLVIMTIIPVQAGKGQEKLPFELNITQLFEPIPQRILTTAPKWETPPYLGGDANVVFVEIDYTATVLSVDIGTDTLVPSDVELETGVINAAVYWNGPTPGSKIMDKDEFTLDFSGYFGTSAKIEFRRVAKKDETTGLTSGTLVGHGTDILKDVKVSGVQMNTIGDITGQSLQLIGTIMGWPIFP
jgi:hypothetical protein